MDATLLKTDGTHTGKLVLNQTTADTNVSGTYLGENIYTGLQMNNWCISNGATNNNIMYIGYNDGSAPDPNSMITIKSGTNGGIKLGPQSGDNTGSFNDIVWI